MKLSSLLNPKLIKCRLAARTKDEALHEVAEVMAAGPSGVSVGELTAALAEREKLGPFSMAKGSAFPHARTEKVAEFRIAVGTAPPGIDFRAPDGKPIRLIALFAIPRNHSNLYLTTLAQFLNLLASEENLEEVIGARSGEELIATVEGLGIRPAAPVAPALASVTPQMTLSKVLELISATRAESLPVLDDDGNLVGELTTGALLQLGVREHLLCRSGAARGQGGGDASGLLWADPEATLDSLGVLSREGMWTVQEDEPLIEMAIKLCHAGARSAYVLRGRRLVGKVTTGEILKRIAGGK